MKRLFCKLGRQWSSVALFLFSAIICGYVYLSDIAAADILTVTIAGSGTGAVNSNPSGIACTSSTSPCSAAFTNLSGITLTATPDWKSLDGVFSVGCSGTSNCFFNIDGATGVNATFDPDYQAALLITLPVVLPKFASLNDAYAYAHQYGKSNFSLHAHVNTFYENFILFHTINFTFGGGRGSGSGYYEKIVDGFTTLQGNLEVQYGSVTIDSLIIQ